MTPLAVRMRPALLPIALLLAASAFAALICQNGVPTLRHDWDWPRSRELAVPWLWDSSQGWSQRGFGSERPYPTDYIVDVALGVSMAVFGTFGGLFVVCFAMGGIVFLSGALLVRRTGKDTPVALRIGAGLLALFNPWTYNEVVAGHILMILAAGGLGLTVVTLRERRPAPIFVLLLCFHQLQFFVPALLLSARRLVAERNGRFVAIIALVISPIVLGMVVDRQTLLDIPRLVSWERGQAVMPLDALLLRGYFPGYDTAIEPWSEIGGAICAFGALVGLWRGRMHPAAWWAAITILVVTAFVGALASPISPFVARLYASVPVLSLYRESYDLIGVLVIGYLVLWGYFAPSRIGAGVACVAAGCFLAGWMLAPPSRWWVSDGALPNSVRDVPMGTRIALEPAFQPLSFDGRGSGSDPDAILYPAGGSALNEYLPRYPAVAALASFTRTGKTDELAALSVSRIVCRPWFATVRLSVSRVVPWEKPTPCRDQTIEARPELELLEGAPQIVSVGKDLAAPGVLFVDAHVGPHLVPLSSERSSADPQQGWIDASLAFAARPEIAQAFGGRYTRSDRPLSLPPAGAALVAALHGTLEDASGRVVTQTRTFAWKPLDRAASLRCRGECVIAALADAVPEFPAEARARRGLAVTFRRPLPWLVIATLPAHGDEALVVWNEQDSPRWRLYGSPNRYARTNGVVNGWIVPADEQPRPVVILHLASAFQALLELAALVAIAVTALGALKRWVSNLGE